MPGLKTPPPTQQMQDAGTAPTSHTGLIRHEKYYNTGAPDPIFIQVCYRSSHTPKLSH